MEKRTCKLCFKTFSNGRALGGHMRSHMLKLQANPSPPPPLPPPPPPPPQAASHLFRQLEYQTDSASYGYSSEEEEEKGLSYGLRENPRKSFRLVDPEFASFAVDAGSVVQDRESETESSRNPSRRRSKRSRKTGLIELPTHLQNQEYGMRKKPNSSDPIRAELAIEQEPVSSVSDTTPEEDVALCLMMLSRGITISRKGKEVEEEDSYDDEQDEEEEEEKLIEESEDELEETKIRVKRSRGKFQCDTCKKFFRSYQALGGHRASHKKNKGCINNSTTYDRNHHQGGGNVVSATPPPTATNAADPRIHECPVCLRVFSSGQALGGHKRSHLTGAASSAQQQQQPIRTNIANPTTTRLGNNLKLIDLNLPAPMDDEDQIELSAVSDGEFNKFS